jgi:diguanylate cyclase (GGDEF)-like protein
MKSRTTKQMIFRIVIIISSAEFSIMLLLGVIPFEVSIFSAAVLNFTLLALLSTPLIYYWAIKPFVTVRNESFDEIHHMAHTDPLTQLPNRRLFSKHLENFIAGTVRHKVHGAVLLMDLDGFKVVNDRYGHDAGDEVLVEIAKRLRSDIRSEDISGRLGGDEFFIFIQHLDVDERTARDTVLWITEKLINMIKKPISFNGQTLSVSVSIGVCLLGFKELDTKIVIRQADTAMYRAKQRGGGCAVFYEKEMNGISFTT